MFKLDPTNEPIDFPNDAYGAFLTQNFDGLKNLNFDALFHLINIVKYMNRGMDGFCKTMKVTRHQWQILVYLNYKQLEGGASPAELAELSKLTRASITRHLDELETQGWIVRGPNPSDGRGFKILLAPAARQKMQTILPTHYSLLRNLLNGFSTADEDHLIRLLIKIRANFGPQNQSLDYDLSL